MKKFTYPIDDPHDLLGDAERRIEELEAELDNYMKLDEEGYIGLVVENTYLQQENKRLREAFEKASKRIMTGRSKRLNFQCSHCGKNTPLLIDGLLKLAGDTGG